METLKDVKARHPKAAVFVSRSAGLKLLPLGVSFTGGVIDEDADSVARERISEINGRLAELQAGAVEDREQAAEETRLLVNERNVLAASLGRELGVAVIPRSGTVTLAPGRQAEAGAVLEFLRAHHLREETPTDGGTFWELAA